MNKSQHIDIQLFFENALALHQAGKQTEAESLYRRILGIAPQHGGALHLLGVLEHQKHNPTAAVELITQAIQANPENASFHSNLGVVLRSLKRYDEALMSYDRAVALDPKHADAYYNRGIILAALNRHDDARRSYERVLAINPNYADAGLNLGICYLKLGYLHRGWRLYEHRWENKPLGNLPKPAFAQPLWLGDKPLMGKTILLHAEQGLGDTIQFCRYAKKLAASGAAVLLEVQPELKSLLAEVAGVAQVFAKGEKLPEFDYHCPLMSLPLAFDTSLNTIPCERQYLFADQHKITGWQSKIGDHRMPRIGLVWSGGTLHKNDHNRSMPLLKMTGLLSGPMRFFSLQKDVRPTDQAVLESSQNLQHFGDQLHDFTDTAALLACMDLVITIDTSVAHLAAAMGKPIWVLLPKNPDWRWMLNRNDSPWYPSARLFRQAAIGDWEGVIADVRRELQQIFGGA